MTTYAEFFLNAPARLIQYQCIEISHPNFTQIYRVVRNKVGGLTATIDGSPQDFVYYPLKITFKGTKANLDYAFEITLGELGDIIPKELDAVAAASGWLTKPQFRYWEFRSDDLTTPMFGPIVLEIPAFPQTNKATTFIAQAPSLNLNRTGEIYLPSRFPMLDGLL